LDVDGAHPIDIEGGDREAEKDRPLHSRKRSKEPSGEVGV
jgi:hypothetical protein